MTLPPPPHRCPPSPYERACLIAASSRSARSRAAIIILDPKDSPRPITGGFQEAFENLYKDQITYVPKAVIKEVDPFNKKIKTSVGDFSFDHSILMAPHQAGDMAWKAGVIGKNAEGKPTGWAGVDPLLPQHEGRPGRLRHRRRCRHRLATVQLLPEGRPRRQRARQDRRQIHRRTRKPARPEVRVPDNLCFMMVNTATARGHRRALPVPRRRQGRHHPGPGSTTICAATKWWSKTSPGPGACMRTCSADHIHSAQTNKN
jgi:hypothetical protein